MATEIKDKDFDKVANIKSNHLFPIAFYFLFLVTKTICGETLSMLGSKSVWEGEFPDWLIHVVILEMVSNLFGAERV